MNNIDKFFAQVQTLSNSLVIKFNDIALQMEQIATNNLFPDLSALEDWRYYRHLAGMLYPTDDEVLIKVIETEKEEPLSKALLDQYPLTKQELMKGEDYYKSLINLNSNMVSYIHGCLYPIEISEQEIMDFYNSPEYEPIDTSITDEDREIISTRLRLKKSVEAEDGTILNYNKELIEYQEDNIIPEIEMFIKNYITRFYNRKYQIIEELYLPSFLGVLYTFIPYKIINIRIKNINTNRANSFFLEAFFRSRFDLWDNVNALRNRKTVWWLYSNLDRLIKNIGQNATLDEILTRIFNADNIGIGINYLKYQDPIINSTPYDNKVLPYEKSEPLVFVDKLNQAFDIKDNTTKTLDTVLEEELSFTNTYKGERKDYVRQSLHDDIIRRSHGTNITKLTEINTLENFTGWNTDVYSILLDYWGYLLSVDGFGSFTDPDITTVKVEFVDPNTKRKYNINSLQGYYMFLKIILHVNNAVEQPLKEIVINTVLDPNARLDNIVNKKLFQDGFTQKHYPFIKANYPIPNKNYTSYADVSKLLTSVVRFYKDLWILTCNSENSIVSANLRTFIYLATKQDKIAIHSSKVERTIDELLSDVNIDFVLSEGYDHMASIKELLKVCLGVITDPNNTLQDLLRNFKELFRKMTSYTLQVAGNISNEDYVYMYANGPRPFLAEKGVVKLFEDRLEGKPYKVSQHFARFVPGSNDSPFAFVYEDVPVVNADPSIGFRGFYDNSTTEKGLWYIQPLPTLSETSNPNPDKLVQLLGLYYIHDSKQETRFGENTNKSSAEEIPNLKGLDPELVPCEYPATLLDMKMPDFVPFVIPEK